MKKNNIFENIIKRKKEIFTTILKNNSFKLERIVSYGQSTPSGIWLEQDWDEWVLLIDGSAELIFAELTKSGTTKRKKYLKLKPGDFVNIPAHQKHRVEWTKPEKKTVWLALHYK